MLVNNTNLAHKFEGQDAPSAEINNNQMRLVNKTEIKTDPLDQIIMKKTRRQHVKDFGLVMACAMTIISAFQIYLNKDRENIVLILSALSCSIFLASIYTPRLVLPLFSGWMFIGKYLEKIMTGLILGLMWMITFLPIGVIFKLIGKSTLTLKLDKNAKSYWESCDHSRADFQLLERQY